MFFSGNFNLVDIIYGGSIINLFFWIVFGVGGQAIIVILALGRARYWADTCWGILRAQLPVIVLVAHQTFVFTCCCPMTRKSFVFVHLNWIAGVALYALFYFLIMSLAISLRYRTASSITAFSFASLLAVIIDLNLTLVMAFLVID